MTFYDKGVWFVKEWAKPYIKQSFEQNWKHYRTWAMLKKKGKEKFRKLIGKYLVKQVYNQVREEKTVE